MSKKLTGVIAATAMLSALAIGVTAFAAEARPLTAGRLTTAASESDYGADYFENRRQQYEEYLNEQVRSGAITQQEADQYKQDYDSMLDYCIRYGGRSGQYGGYGGCCGR